MPQKPKPSPTELAEKAAKQLAKDRAIVAHLDGRVKFKDAIAASEDSREPVRPTKVEIRGDLEGRARAILDVPRRGALIVTPGEITDLGDIMPDELIAAAAGKPSPLRAVQLPPKEPDAVVDTSVTVGTSPAPVIALKAVQLPPKRSDGWGKPVIIEVKAIREER